MAGYSANSGLAMFVYRPVHRRVTAATRSSNAQAALLGALSAKDPFGSARGCVAGRRDRA